MKTLEQFKNDTLGGSFGNPGTGTFKGQCVSYVRLYMEEVLGIKTIINGHASNYYNSAFMAQHFDKVTDGSRRDGDILCWGDDAGNWTGPEGHIGIAYQGRILNQNYGGSLKVSINDFFPHGYQGALRRKGGDMLIQDTDREFARWSGLFQHVRGRIPTRAEFRANAVGKTWLRAIEILMDNAEAKTALNWLNVGKVAVTDKWQTQILNLIKERDALKAQIAGDVAAKKLQSIKDALA